MSGVSSRLALGDVLATTVRTLRTCAIPIGLGCALAILPFAAMDLVFAHAGGSSPMGMNIVSAIMICWLEATIAQLALGAIDRSEVTFSSAARAARASVGTVFALSVLQSIAVGLGLVLLVVPGVLIWAWSHVVVPVYLFEGAYGRAGFARSGELTKGHRGPIVVLGVITYGVLGMGMLASVSPLVVAAMEGEAELDRAMGSELVGDGIVLALSLVQAAFVAFSSVARTVVYARLRDLHADVDGDAIAEVFA